MSRRRSSCAALFAEGEIDMAEITGFWQSNLREKAILFSRHGYASTYLVFASYQGSVVLIGHCQKVRRQKKHEH